MPAQPRAIMLFAAGLGLRMRPLTADRPKCLIPVGGKPLVDHAIALAIDQGLGPIVVNTHCHASLLAAHLADRNILISHEKTMPLDTGGGLKNALGLLGQPAARPIFTLNTDAVWFGEKPLTQLADAWSDRCDALLLLTLADGSGDFDLGSEGHITRGLTYRYTGAQIIRPDRIAAYPKAVFSLNAIWDDMIAAGAARGLVMTGGWCDVGTPKAVERAETMLRAANG